MFGLGLFEIVVLVIIGILSYVLLLYACRRLNIPKSIALIGLLPGGIFVAVCIIIVWKIVEAASQRWQK